MEKMMDKSCDSCVFKDTPKTTVVCQTCMAGGVPGYPHWRGMLGLGGATTLPEFDEERIDTVGQNGNEGLHYESRRMPDGRLAVRLKDATALKTQVGGSHYKEFAIQPAEFIEKNGLSFLAGCVVKRMCRWQDKDGLRDLEKAKHEIDLLIEIHKLREKLAEV